MKPKKQKQGGSRKPAAQPTELTPAQKDKLAEWNRLTKFPEYEAKIEELRLTNPNPEELHRRAVTALHALMAQEAWFGDNTPYPFKVTHWSQIESVAHLACRYLRTVALGGNQGAIQTLAQLAVDMTETLTEMTVAEIDSLKSPLRVQSAAIKRNAKLVAELKCKFGLRCSAHLVAKSNLEIFRKLARMLPYWPVLYSQKQADKKHLSFLAEQLKLGEDCPINATKKARYSLQTPMNALLWHCLRHFESVHSSIRRSLQRHPYPGWPFKRSGWRKFEKPEARTFAQAIAPLVFERGELPLAINPFMSGKVHRDEIPIYKKSFDLPPLTNDKDIATKWANEAIVPFVEARFPKRIPTGKSGRLRRSVFRKQVIQQLRQIARKADATT